MQWNSEAIDKISRGDVRCLARAISTVENEEEGYYDLLKQISVNYAIPVIGVTGPPGAGKSTLLNALLSLLQADKKVAILAVDPTSPFTHGSILGDRLRMSDYFLHPNIFIRSLATRGSLGGLSSRVLEITDVLRSSHFDYIFIETVGVGQNEIEIAYLADTTMLVLNPGAGDDVQALKSGILEIADVFVINKSDKDNAEVLHKHLSAMLHLRPASAWNPPIVKTVATENKGLENLLEAISSHHAFSSNERRVKLLYHKAIRLITQHKMKGFDAQHLNQQLSEWYGREGFNFYDFLEKNYFRY